MATTGDIGATLSHSLEDYLEAIYMLARDKAYARVRDIAKARKVKTASVVPALRRLRDGGFIDYRQREYLSLTEKGEAAARRVYARHKALAQFFRDVLRVPAELADADACAMEHGLSSESLDRLVRFLEFVTVCPSGQTEFLEQFHQCGLFLDADQGCDGSCGLLEGGTDEAAKAGQGEAMSIYDLQPGESAKITHVHARGSIRQRLLDMGIVPDTAVEMVRVAPTGNPVWIRLDGTQLALRRSEAEAVLLSRR